MARSERRGKISKSATELCEWLSDSAGLTPVLQLQMIPIPLSRCDSQFVACEPLLEIIEHSEFFPCHHIRCRVCLNFPPYIRQCRLQNVYDRRISRAFGAVPRNF